MLRSPVWLLTAVSFSVYLVLSLCFYRQFQAGYDLGIFDQAVRNYARFATPLVPLKGPHFNILGDHFHPILLVLAPLYWIWNDPRTLLIAQAGLIAASVWVVHSFAARHLGARASIAVAAGYALGWPLQALARFDFHEIAFGVPLLAWALDSLDREDDRSLLIASGLLLLVREDMGVVVVILGALRLSGRRRFSAWRRRDVGAGLSGRRRRKVGVGLILAGIAMYWFSTAVVLPHLSSTGRFAYWNYDALGSNPASALESVVWHPVHAVRLFFTPEQKTETLLLLLIPVGLLCLRSRYSLILLPLLAERFFSSREILWTTQAQYSSISWPVVVLAAIEGGARTRLFGRAAVGRLFGRHALGRLLRRPAPGQLWCALPLTFAVIGTVLSAHVFPARRLFSGQAYSLSRHMRAQDAAVRAVPRGVCVVTDDHLAVHFTSHDRVSLPGRLGRAADFTVLDLSRTQTGFDTPSPQLAMRAAVAAGATMIFSSDDVEVLRSSDYRGPTKECRP